MSDTNLTEVELQRINEYKSHQKWIHAFNSWFHDAARERIHSNLHEGVFLSVQNSKFLGSILDGSIKPLKAKQTGLALFKNSVINNKIQDLHNRGYSREAILADLKRTELVKGHFAITGLDKRKYRNAKTPMQIRADLDKKFQILYNKITKT